jgi:hypothetical protein
MEEKLMVFSLWVPQAGQTRLDSPWFVWKKGNILHLAEVEMLERMPVLDVKSLVPNFDHGEDVWTGSFET